MNKTITVCLGLVVILVAVYVASKGSWGEVQEEKSRGFNKFQEADFAATTRIQIGKGKADPKVADDIFKSVSGIIDGEEVAELKSSHKNFEVDDIRGSALSFFGGGGVELGSLVVGKTAQSRDLNKTLIFARFGADDETYKISSKLRSDAKLWSKIENKNYIEKEIFKLESEDEIFELRLSRPGQDDLLVERKSEVVPVEEEDSEGAGKEEKKDEGEKKEPETKTVEYFVTTSGSKTQRVDADKEWSAKSLIDKGRSLRIEDVADPKELLAYGLDKPQLKASCKYRVKGKADSPVKEVSVLFGNAIKDEKGEDKEFYLTLAGEGKAGRIYTVSKWAYEGWDKKFEDFLPEPEEEKKPDDEAAAPALPGPSLPGKKPGEGGAAPAEEKKDSSAGAEGGADDKLPGAGAEDGEQSKPAGG